MTAPDALERGRAAFQRRAWGEAFARLSEADRGSPLDADDLDRLAMAAYLTGREAESARAWERAHQALLERGDVTRAVRCAFWIAFGLLQRGAVARGGGWLARAQRLVDGVGEECVEQGYLLSRPDSSGSWPATSRARTPSSARPPGSGSGSGTRTSSRWPATVRGGR